MAKLLDLKRHDLINGNTRKYWIRAAAKAMVSSTTPGGRFLVLRAGFVAFQRVAKPAFDNEVNFNLTSTELRWIFEYIGRYVQRHEWHMQPGLELLYQKQRRTMSHDAIGVEDSSPGEIVVEKVRDGSLRRVH